MGGGGDRRARCPRAGLSTGQSRDTEDRTPAGSALRGPAGAGGTRKPGGCRAADGPAPPPHRAMQGGPGAHIRSGAKA